MAHIFAFCTGYFQVHICQLVLANERSRSINRCCELRILFLIYLIIIICLNFQRSRINSQFSLRYPHFTHLVIEIRGSWTYSAKRYIVPTGISLIITFHINQFSKDFLLLCNILTGFETFSFQEILLVNRLLVIYLFKPRGGYQETFLFDFCIFKASWNRFVVVRKGRRGRDEPGNLIFPGICCLYILKVRTGDRVGMIIIQEVCYHSYRTQGFITLATLCKQWLFFGVIYHALCSGWGLCQHIVCLGNLHFHAAYRRSLWTLVVVVGITLGIVVDGVVVGMVTCWDSSWVGTGSTSPTVQYGSTRAGAGSNQGLINSLVANRVIFEFQVLGSGNSYVAGVSLNNGSIIDGIKGPVLEVGISTEFEDCFYFIIGFGINSLCHICFSPAIYLILNGTGCCKFCGKLTLECYRIDKFQFTACIDRTGILCCLGIEIVSGQGSLVNYNSIWFLGGTVVVRVTIALIEYGIASCIRLLGYFRWPRWIVWWSKRVQDITGYVATLILKFRSSVSIQCLRFAVIGQVGTVAYRTQCGISLLHFQNGFWVVNVYAVDTFTCNLQCVFESACTHHWLNLMPLQVGFDIVPACTWYGVGCAGKVVNCRIIPWFFPGFGNFTERKVDWNRVDSELPYLA